MCSGRYCCCCLPGRQSEMGRDPGCCFCCCCLPGRQPGMERQHAPVAEQDHHRPHQAGGLLRCTASHCCRLCSCGRACAVSTQVVPSTQAQERKGVRRRLLLWMHCASPLQYLCRSGGSLLHRMIDRINTAAAVAKSSRLLYLGLFGGAGAACFAAVLLLARLACFCSPDFIHVIFRDGCWTPGESCGRWGPK